MKTVRELYDRGVQNGVPDLQILDKRAVHEIEPALAETVVGALFAPTAALSAPTVSPLPQQATPWTTVQSYARILK